MSRNEVALSIFCALLARDDCNYLFPNVAERHIQNSFEIADLFLRLANTSTSPVPLLPLGGVRK